jgi:hypothetical protein
LTNRRRSTPYDREAFSRRRRLRIDVDVDPYVKSVEDSVLKKLQWLNDGGGVSSTQWRGQEDAVPGGPPRKLVA